jgi:hypothetical protein
VCMYVQNTIMTDVVIFENIRHCDDMTSNK